MLNRIEYIFYNMWMEIIGVVGILTAIGIALFGWWSVLGKEKRAQKRKLLGWLTCLFSYLDQIEKGVLEPNKLQWWADHVLQEAGYTFDVLSKEDNDNLATLLSKAWSVDIFSSRGEIFVEAASKRVESYPRLDSEKLNSMRTLINDLKTKLSHR